ncbi:hypothetical protein TcYC6_0037030 [Trypanosoma cruzi]|nr:hypothetical protein TcYC6_0037030 [Trypanosoma cruzi]
MWWKEPYVNIHLLAWLRCSTDGTMKLRLFGGMDCPDSVLARLAVVAAVEPVAAAKMSDHAVTILLLTTHEDARETDSDGLGVLDVQNKLFFSQREMMEIGVARVAQALTAIHTVVLNIVKYDVSDNDAVRELGILGLSEESAAAVVSPVQTHRMELASALLRQTPRVSFGCFGSLDGEKSARRHLVHEASFGACDALPKQRQQQQQQQQQQGKKEEGVAGQLYDMQIYARQLPSQPPSSSPSDSTESKPLMEVGVAWRMPHGHFTLCIPAQKARALLAELLLARETLRRAWTPIEPRHANC